MLDRSSGRWRWRVAGLTVALYTLCLLTPTAVMAFGQATIPAHCLSDDRVGIAAAHVHHDGTAHHHSSGKTDDGDRDGKCCGLFGVSAIAPAEGPVVAPLDPASQPPPLAVNGLNGRGSDRIDRPPRPSLSL